jgi:3-oxoacyl-[acyl-carrier protein] reductase
MRLKDKKVLITGAGGQLGASFSQSFVEEGAALWLSDLSPELLAKTAQKIPPENLLGTLVLDVTEPKSVEKAFAKIQEYGVLDVLVNNAGVGVFTPFWERDYREFMQVMSVNAGGTFLCTREALRLMQNYGQGSIINIGSIYGVVSSDPSIYSDCSRMNSEVYSASKAAVIQLTKYFAVHAASLGVRVNCVSPGGVSNNQGKDFINNYSKRTPFNRMAKELEICGAVIFLASEDASYISGQNIVVDGGFTAW